MDNDSINPGINNHQSVQGQLNAPIVNVQENNQYTNNNNPATKNNQSIAAQLNAPPAAITPVFADQYFTDPSGFAQDIYNFSLYSKIKTGFNNLDATIDNLYPGLYVLGAITSLGKTTFAHHMGDNIAKAGIPVLFFSLEMSTFEVMSKSISRELYIENKTTNDPSIPTFSSMELRKGCGRTDPHVQSVISNYANSVGNNVCVVPSMFSMTVEGIMATTDNYMAAYNRIPVVIIDYLQIIQPSYDASGRLMDTRTAIDHILHCLKVYQNRYHMVVILISSLNRHNYLDTIDYEAFKESGGIEYTADVIWGLQLKVLSDAKFINETKVTPKRDMQKKAKAAIPRSVDLVCIKNRFGTPSYTCSFKYYPDHDYFEEDS